MADSRTERNDHVSMSIGHMTIHNKMCPFQGLIYSQNI